jgi:predicted RNase H-like HicB family nuclease
MAMRRAERVSAKTRVYAAIYEWDPDVGVYVVTFPAFPNLATQGTTLRDARAMAAECLEIHIEGLVKRGISVPAGERRPKQVIREGVRVTMKVA